MPLLYYLCPCKKFVSKFYRSLSAAPSDFDCECGLKMKKQLSAPSNASKVTIDNGVQAKSIDVNLDVIASNLENSTRDFSKK